MSGALAQLKQAAELYSLPDLYIRVKAIMDDPDFALVDVAEVISHDPGMTARLLKMVNSPFFGFGVEIDTVSRAVGMLGAQQVHDLVLATSVTQSFAGISEAVMDMRSFWTRSVHRGVTARVLAAHCNVLDSERLLVVGLLSDIGHLVMYQSLPALAQQAIQRSRSESRALYRVEREILGLDYAQFGAMLLREWSLPRSLIEPVEHHIEPAHAKDFALETAILHLARHLAEAMRPDQSFEPEVLAVDATAWRITGLASEQCETIRDEAAQQMDVVLDLILPPKAVGPRRACA
jgi:HD-like signal output (HDOD) protein